MSRPLPTDIAARTVSEQLELADARGDADLALSAARTYVAMGLAIRVCAGDFAQIERRETPEDEAEALMVAKFAGRCCRCKTTFAAGARIAYDGETKRTTCERCSRGGM